MPMVRYSQEVVLLSSECARGRSFRRSHAIQRGNATSLCSVSTQDNLGKATVLTPVPVESDIKAVNCVPAGSDNFVSGFAS